MDCFARAVFSAYRCWGCDEFAGMLDRKVIGFYSSHPFTQTIEAKGKKCARNQSRDAVRDYKSE